MISTWIRRDARFDVPASLVVFLVAVPLSLGIATATGAPVAAGLVAAAVGGIVAGVAGGSRCRSAVRRPASPSPPDCCRSCSA